MSSKLILYNYARSSCSWRVRAVLEHKNLRYEYRPVSIYAGEQHAESFKKMNPLGMIPVLQIQNGDTKTLFESLAIIDHLERLYPDTASVYPSELDSRFRVQAIANMIVSGIQPLQNMGVMKYVGEFTGDKRKQIDWARHWIRMKFGQLETLLSSNGNQQQNYTVGHQLSLSDICLAPQVLNAIRYGIDLAPYPTIKRIYEHLMANEQALIKSRPEVQMDFDEKKERKLAGF